MSHDLALKHDPQEALSLFRRYVAFGAALLVCFGLSWMWAGLNWPLRLTGMAWALLGAAWPEAFFLSLALSLPWFGDQPGASPRLALLEMGVAGVVIAHQLRRALRLTPPRARSMDAWMLFFFYYSLVTAMQTWGYVKCEFLLKGWDFLAANFCHYATSPTYGVQASVKMALGVGLYQALRDEPWGERRLRRFFWTALAALTLASVLGALDYAGAFRLTWWRPENADITRFHYRRLQSLFGHSGWFAEYVCLLAPAALGFGVAAKSPWQRRLGWILAAGFVPIQILTMQRGEWIALDAGDATVLALAMKSSVIGDAVKRSDDARRRVIIRSALAFACVIVVSVVALYGASADFRMRASELLAAHDRTRIWLSAWALSDMHRLGGIGLGFYYVLHGIFFPAGHPFFNLDKVTAHNLFLHIFVERGAIGLTFFLCMIVAGGRALTRGWRIDARGQDAPSPASGLALDARLAVAGGLVAFLVDGIVQYAFFTRVEELLFWILLGLATWGMSTPSRASRQFSPWARRARGFVITALLIGTPLVFVWQRHVFRERAWIQGHGMHVGRKIVQLGIPKDGTRFSLRLGAIQTDLEQWPQVLTVTLDGRTLAREEFKKMTTREVKIDLPPTRGPQAKLRIEASRVWNPLRDSGLRTPAIWEVGVLYMPLKSLH